MFTGIVGLEAVKPSFRVDVIVDVLWNIGQDGGLVIGNFNEMMPVDACNYELYAKGNR